MDKAKVLALLEETLLSLMDVVENDPDAQEPGFEDGVQAMAAAFRSALEGDK